MTVRGTLRSMILRLAVVLGCTMASAVCAAPEDALLAALDSELRRPQLRCEWVARHLAQADALLALYREELADIFVALDGTRVAGISDGRTAQVARVDLETRLFGPASATVTLLGSTSRPLPAASTVDGRLLEIGFTDRRGGAHPLFCGIVATSSTNVAGLRSDLVALAPRTGTELRSSGQFTDMTEVDVIASLAGEAGLPLDVQDSRPHSTRPVIAREHVATWPFMRLLAKRLALDLVLKPEGRLQLATAAFVPPAAPPARTWTELTWVEIVSQIAAGSARTADAELTASYPVLSLRQSATDDAFIAELARRHAASAWWSGSRLILRDDGVWHANPAAQSAPPQRTDALQLAQTIAARHRLAVRSAALRSVPVTVVRRGETDAELLLRVLGESGVRLDGRRGELLLAPAGAPGDVTDLLLRRIVIAAGPGRGRSFSRRHADPGAQLADPERIASTEVVLALGGAASTAAAFVPAMAAGPAVARELDAALARLAAGATPLPERRFLQALARVYRPTLIHLYRLRPDGAVALQAIAATP